MHELGISRNIVAVVEEAARGRRVRRVRLEIGKLSGVMRGAIEFSFDLVAAGTPIAGAVLEIEEIDGRGRCSDCATELALPTFFTACPCGSRRVKPIAGEELNIKSVDLED